MSETTTLQLSDDIAIRPHHLLQAHRNVPLRGDYIPLGLFDDFDIVRPNLVCTDTDAILLTLPHAFGFVACKAQDSWYSQKTDSIEFSVERFGHQWSATFWTEEPLAEQDEELFVRGASLYALYAGRRLGITTTQVIS